MATGAAAGVAATAPGVAALKGAQESIEAILSALLKFFVLMRAREDAWILRTMRGRAPQDDILAVIAEENQRAGEFQRRVLERVRRDAAVALNLPTEGERQEAVRKILARERRYARQRSEAMAGRALGALDRVALRRLPKPDGALWPGAYWKLGKAQVHTPDCLAMAGQWWPWEALDVLHPPTHPGCQCSLHGWVEALKLGYDPKRQLWLPVADMVKKAQAAHALLHESEES